MANIKLARLPDRTPMKIVIAVLPDLHEHLAAYAEAYAETYGMEPLADLLPPMLSAFLESDRSFARTRR